MQRRILFIEDHEDTRQLVSFILEASDYSVTSDTTVAAALQMAKAEKFDLYLLDNWLPDGTGFELCQGVREFDGATPILFYSGAVFDSDKLAAIQAGAQGYLEKPCPYSNLLRAVTVLIDHAQGCEAASSGSCRMKSALIAGSLS